MSAADVLAATAGFGSLVTFGSGIYLGLHWHERPWKAEAHAAADAAADAAMAKTRWNNPCDFRCPVCTHRPREHYSSIEITHPKTFLWFTQLQLTRMGCSVKDCLCGRQQEDLMEDAEEWSWEPPSAGALSGHPDLL